MEIAVGSRPGVPQRGGEDAYVAEIVASGVVLLAVAHGFGRIRNVPTATVATGALRSALRRRVRAERRDPRAALAAAMSAANGRVFANSGSTDDFVASGSSLTAALIVGDRAYVGHVGTTRAYLGRAGELSMLTEDDAVGEGALRVVTRAIGTQPTLDVALTNVRLMHGDALVLASRALLEHLASAELAQALAASATEDVTTRLLAVAGVRGDGAGTVIVGRAFNDCTVEHIRGRRPTTRDGIIALSAMVLASLASALVLHAFLPW